MDDAYMYFKNKDKFSMRAVGMDTIAKSDFGIYQSLLLFLKKSSHLNHRIIANRVDFEKNFYEGY